MSDKSPICPSNLFARIETMKKWQMEHQQRLLEQQSQQTEFLSNEQRRMQEAFNEKSVENKNSEIILEEEEAEHLNEKPIPINSPSKNFNMLLEENLNRSSSPVIQNDVRPKRPFLKKGSGLSRFRMTLKDISSNSPQGNSHKINKQEKPNKKLNPKIKEIEAPTAPDYNSLLTELCNARQNDPQIFETPVINKSNEINQQLFERDLIDELKLFEALEQKVSNSSFCSNSSLVQRLMEHSARSTPQKNFNISCLQDEAIASPFVSPKKIVYFADKIEEETTDQSDDDESEILSDSSSTLNSEDISDTPNNKRNCKIICRDAGTNTDFIEQINPDLLKRRLEELETEIETFRSENARINKMKCQLENDSQMLEKQKKKLHKEVEDEKQKIEQQLNEEKKKLMKDKQVYDKYIRESRDGRSLRQKDREELSALRSHLSVVQEELKQKESKWGATHARLRNQVRHLEKENTTLKIENTELRSKNAKLEATNKQLLTRKPSDTKVLHEINKNLTKLTKTKSEAAVIPLKKTTSKEEEQDENTTTQNFQTVEEEYEKMFGRSNKKIIMPSSEVSYTDTTNNRRDEITLEDGSVQITYPNGNVRCISPNGKNIVMKYHNGDVKETCKNSGTVRYLYADAKVWHTTYPDGLELLEFANGQIEKRFGDGSSEILFPNGCRRCTTPNGSEDVCFPDGTNLLTKPQNGEKILTLPNGQKEIHTADHKRREYPDGTVKLLYPDGIQETRYANGRIRLKDKDGNLIMDSANV